MGKIMSAELKHFLARQMGVEHKIIGEHSDYGNLTSRECGNFVKLAVAMAEKQMV